MKYYLIAGEASGDLHASNLMRELKIQDPAAVFRCWGGDLMEQQGGVIVRHFRDLAFMGFLEVVVHLPRILENLRFCEKDVLQFNPDVLILVDYPGFNLRIARFANTKGIRVFYYISPQLWAWKSSRVKTIRKTVEHMFVILPFEQAFYRKHGIEADFPGHPLLDVIHDGMKLKNREQFLRENNLDNKPIIALLPGSRKMEIRTMLSVMLETIHAFPGYQFVVAAAPSLPMEFYNSISGKSNVKIVPGQTYDLLSNSVAAMVTSGTATLETALMKVPEVVCYKGNPISFAIAKRIVKVEYISLVNLVAGRAVVKELIQDSFNSPELIAEVKRLLTPGIQKDLAENYDRVKDLLGGRGASGRAAVKMVQYLTQKTVK